MACDGLSLTSSVPTLTLAAVGATLSLVATDPALILQVESCILELTVDSTLSFEVETQNLELTSTPIDVCLTTPIPVGTGEPNTASNCGDPLGVGFFHQKIGVDLEFRNLRSTDGSLTVALNSPDCTVDLTFDPTFREQCNITPTGANDGVNDVYTLPEDFLPDTMKLYRNGVRQARDDGGGCDYALSESGGVGTGHDTVTVSHVPLLSWESLLVDYVVAV